MREWSSHCHQQAGWEGVECGHPLESEPCAYYTDECMQGLL